MSNYIYYLGYNAYQWKYKICIPIFYGVHYELILDIRHSVYKDMYVFSYYDSIKYRYYKNRIYQFQELPLSYGQKSIFKF